MPIDTPRHLRRAAATLFAAASLAAPATSTAQTFTRITTGNPIVTDPVPAAAQYTGCAWVDFDADGDQDLYIVQQGLYRNDGAQSFTKLATIPPDHNRAIGCSWADYDNDGDPDLFVSGGPPGGSYLWRNDGGGAFTKLATGTIADVVGNQGWGCAWGDYDVDGRVDLVIAAARGFLGITTPNHLLHNDGGDAFTRVDTSAVCAAVGPYTTATWNDVDDDGDPDLFIAAGPVNGLLLPDYVYTNQRTAPGETIFTRDLTSPPATDPHDGQLFNWVDIDSDGDLDCFLTNYGAGTGGVVNVLYRNDGGAFVAMTPAQAGTLVSEIDVSLASVWADFDNDGDMDGMVTNDGSDPTRYYTNDGHGFFTEVVPSGVRIAGPHYGAATADYDGDGDVDVYVHGLTARRGLFRNDLDGTNGWLDVRCVGAVSNRSAIGARVWVRATIGGVSRRLVQQVSAQNSFGGHGAFDLHFGLGDAAVADEVVIRFPSGIEQTITNVAARQVVTVTEDVSTAIAASVVSADAVGGRARIVWQIGEPDGAPVTIVRRTETTAWTAIAAASVDGSGRVTFTDPDVAPGVRRGYAIEIGSGGSARRLGETWVAIPRASAPALQLVGRNPVSDRLRIALEVQAGADVDIRVIEASGRVVVARELRDVAAGRREIDLGSTASLSPGIYWVRTTLRAREAGRTAGGDDPGAAIDRSVRVAIVR